MDPFRAAVKSLAEPWELTRLTTTGSPPTTSRSPVPGTRLFSPPVPEPNVRSTAPCRSQNRWRRPPRRSNPEAPVDADANSARDGGATAAQVSVSETSRNDSVDSIDFVDETKTQLISFGTAEEENPYLINMTCSTKMQAIELI